MRKRIYARIVAGLLCGTLLFTDMTSTGVQASSTGADEGQAVALTELDDESGTNDIAAVEEKKEETTEENTEEKAEEEALPAEKTEGETAESDTTKETDGKNIGAETEKPEEMPTEEEPSEEELLKEDISKEEQTEEEERPEEGTENADQKEEETEEEEQPAKENDEEISEPEGEEVPRESVSENTIEVEMDADSVVPAAAGDIASGSINEKYGQMSWVIDADGKLTVRGTGDYKSAPWLEYATDIKSAEIIVSGMTNAVGMFNGCTNLTSVNLKYLDTSIITDMGGMFWDCSSLKSLDLTNFDTSNVACMAAMFKRCTSLTSLDLGSFDTSNVREMDFMFDKCQSLTTLDLSRFETSNVEYLHGMFRGCSGITVLDLSSFDLSKVTTAQQSPFEDCNNLKTIYTPRNLSQRLSLPQPDPYGKEKWKWYNPDGKVVTTLPQDLNYSIILGKDYIPTETPPENPPDDEEPEEEPLTGNEKFVQNVTKYSLANADEQTKKSIQKALYDLLFRAHFAPQGQDPDKTVTFPGVAEYNRKWPYQNGIAVGQMVNDPRLGTVTYAKACTGCLSYARFVSQYIYGHIVEAKREPVKDKSLDELEPLIKKLIYDQVDSGEIIGFSNSTNQKKSHFVVFLGESGNGNEFYCLSYGGGGENPKKEYHTIELIRFSYRDFIKKYVVGNKCDEFVYYDTTGGSFRSQTGKTITNPASTKIEVACPGAAVIERNEEKLDSRTPGTASFGNVSQNGDHIIFDLTYSPDYNLSIAGTGEGTMTVMLTYYDDAGNQINQRKFVNVPVTASTEVESGGFDHIADFVLYVSNENGEMSAWGAGPGETVYAPDDAFLPESSFEYAVDDETGIHYKDIPESGEISNGLWISAISDYTYTGTAIKPEVRVYDGEKRLKPNKDYTVSYRNNTKAAQADDAKPPTIVVKGKGNYSGTETQTFNITKRDISDTCVSKTFTDAYVPLASGKNPALVFSAKCNKKGLKKNTDYTLTIKDSAGRDTDFYATEGAYSLVVKGTGSNYTGECSFSFEVLDKIPVSKLKINKIAAIEFDGTSKRPQPVIKYGKVTLNKGADYSLRYQNNREMGTATITITGKGEYFGTRNVTFTITGRQIKKAKFVGFKTSFPYKGDTVYQSEAVLKYGEEELVLGTDYTTSYNNHLNKGKATVTYIGLGNYTGTLKKTYNIAAYNIASDVQNRISLSTDEICTVYEKGGSRPSVKVYDGMKLLTEGKDYTLSYQNHTAVTTQTTVKPPTITVKGKGNYTGVFAEKKTFTITPKAFTEVTITAPDVAASPKTGRYKAVPVLTDTNGKKLKAGTDYNKIYTYTYKHMTEKVLNNETEVTRNAGDSVEENDIIPANTVLCVHVTAKEGGNYTGEKAAEYRIVAAPIDKARITVQNPAQNNRNLFLYTGQEICIDKSNLVVKVGTEVLSDDQYEILEDTYKNNINKGTASVQIRGVGNLYGGTATVKFKIGTKGFQWFWRLFG